MASIGIFYGSTNGKVENIAYEIQTIFGKENAEVKAIRNATKYDLNKYKYLVFGTSTENGDIQSDWKSKLSVLKKLDYTDKKIALYCLGDQRQYPLTFADGLGVLYQHLSEMDADIIGNWYPQGYVFQKSKALIDGSFVGLVLDDNFQPNVTQVRLTKWTDFLKSQFKNINFPTL